LGQPINRDYRQAGLLWLVLLAGLGLTFMAARESVRTSEQQVISKFRASAEVDIDRLQGQLITGLRAAHYLYLFYGENDEVSRETFRLLVKTNSNLNRNRRFVSLAYGITEKDSTDFLAVVNDIYKGDYQIRLPEGMTAPGDNIRQFPLLFIWSKNPDDQENLRGLNIGAIPEINGFLEAALRAKVPSAVLLSSFPSLDGSRQDGDMGGQVLIANPYLSKGGNDLLILQLVDFNGLISSIRPEKSVIQSSLRLSARTNWGGADHIVEFSEVDGTTEKSWLKPYSKQFELGAGHWTISVSAATGAFPVSYFTAFLTACVGLLLTGLIFFIIWSQQRRAKRVANIVYRRTRALKEAHDELEEHYKLLQNLNKDVEESRRSAELANRAKSEFLATMSHELRTPLNAILGFSQLLSEQAIGPIGDDRYIEYAKDIHSSGSHLLSLINDILDLAKLEAGKVEIEKNAVSTRLITDKVIGLLTQQAENKGIELYAEFEENMPDKILGDELRLRQIMINLCSNAIKFTQEGSVVARLFSKPFQNGRQGWVLEIQDTGIGIPEEKQATLFDRFTQVDAALSRRHGGVGLGLAICRELVDRMEGRISVRSMVNVGTAIRVHLPLEEASIDDLENEMII
jgi:signal transduction histidine kinase